jgi:hypothetical protein
VHSWPYGAQSPLACEGIKAHTVHQGQYWGLTMLQCAPNIVRKIVLSGQCELLSQNPDFIHCKGSFPITSHGDSKRKWNVGHPFLLWYSAQLGWQSWQLYVLAAHCPQGNLLVLISIRGWVDPKAYRMRTEGIGHLKISKDPTGHRIWNLPSFGIVPQPTAPL